MARNSFPQQQPYYENQNDSQHGYTPFKSHYFQGKNNNQQKRAIVKHSGCKSTKYHPTKGPNAGHEMTLTSGWRLSKGELISIRCNTTAKSKLGDKGWLGSISCTFTNTKTGATSFHWGTMEHKTGKVVIDSMALVCNPKAKNGGYCGTYLKS